MRVLLDEAAAAGEYQIIEHLPGLLSNMLTLANGVWVLETTSDGEETVYRRPPDRGANEYLINRVMGKPTEKTESDVKVSGNVTIYLPERKAD